MALAFGAACGPRKGPEADVTYFWRVTSSTVEFGDCSDSPDFRTDIQALPFTENSYVVYKVDKAVKTAQSMTCTRLDASTCTPSESGIAFAIAGTELTFTRSLKQAIGTSGCSMQQDETWTLRDEITTFSMAIANVLSLVDGTTACDNIEANLKARSPNGLGVRGCVVTFNLGGVLR